MNALSLCAGIGGIDFGIKLAEPNYRTICYVEIEHAVQDILLARMADGLLDRAPVWGDLAQFDGRPWRGLVDVVHGGYPCQPFSTAGRRRGTDDQRHLWPHVARVVRECEPEWCFVENVAGHLSLGADDVVRDLVDMGYRVAMGVFAASEVGAPHDRERLFILAHACAVARVPVSRGEPDVARDRGGRPGVSGQPPAAAGVAAVGYPKPWPPGPDDAAWCDVVAADPTLAPSVVDRGGPRLNPAFLEWLMGFPRGWTEGVSWRARVAALGNAVVPAVAALAWCELHDAVAPLSPTFG